MPSPRAAKQDAPPAEERKLMPWEGGEPEIVDVEPWPLDDEMRAFFERRDRGHMTPQDCWVCILKPNAVHDRDGKIYRFRRY